MTVLIMLYWDKFYVRSAEFIRYIRILSHTFYVDFCRDINIHLYLLYNTGNIIKSRIVKSGFLWIYSNYQQFLIHACTFQVIMSYRVLSSKLEYSIKLVTKVVSSQNKSTLILHPSQDLLSYTFSFFKLKSLSLRFNAKCKPCWW